MYKIPKGKIQKKAYKALATTRKVLLWVAEEVIDGDFDISPLWFHHTGRNMTKEEKYWAKYAEAKRAIQQLKRTKLVRIRKEGDRAWCLLTDKGRQEALKERVRIAEKLPEDYVCMISFDVPEQERAIRQHIRRLLKDWGFKMDHQSLWTTDKDIFVPFYEYMKDLKSFKWFRIYEARVLK